MTTIFWLPTGLRVTYDGDAFVVEDLNPQRCIQNRVTRWEIFKMGLCLIAASIPRRNRNPNT